VRVFLSAAAADLFRALTPSPEEISLSDELTPQSDLYREAMLRSELSRLRGLLDQYAARHAGGRRPSSYPQSLDDLVREGYLPELPVDPMTGERDWQPEGPGVPFLRRRLLLRNLQRTQHIVCYIIGCYSLQ
jgi:hypothetical protein